MSLNCIAQVHYTIYRFGGILYLPKKPKTAKNKLKKTLYSKCNMIRQNIVYLPEPNIWRRRRKKKHICFVYFAQLISNRYHSSAVLPYLNVMYYTRKIRFVIINWEIFLKYISLRFFFNMNATILNLL